MLKKFHKNKKKFKKRLKIFIQVNIGNEDQKNGIEPSYLTEFYMECKNRLDLDIIGLMCIPPKSEDSKKYFTQMSELKKNLNFNELSMGMSSDYKDAIDSGATFIRIGSKIFGERS